MPPWTWAGSAAGAKPSVWPPPRWATAPPCPIRRAGVWNKKLYAKAQGLAGRTLGILGAGAIAREVIRRGVAFGMPIVLWSRRFDGREAWAHWTQQH